MEQYKIDRINELYKKHKTIGLTEAESAERKNLHKEYIAAHKKSLEAQLKNTVIVDEKGNRRRLTEKP